MRAAGREADAVTWNTVLHSLAVSRAARAASDLLGRHPAPNTVSYNTALLAARDDPGLAAELLSRAEAAGAADVRSYILLLQPTTKERE